MTFEHLPDEESLEDRRVEPPAVGDRATWTASTYLRYYTKRAQGLWEIYAEPSSHFAYSILFVLPLLVLYGIGLSQGKSGNFGHGMLVYVFRIFEGLIGSTLMNVAAAAGVVAGIVFLVRKFIENPVKISPRTPLILAGMLLEMAILGLVLETIRHVSMSLSWPTYFSFRPNPMVLQQLRLGDLHTAWDKIHASIGAGVFEELVYRVLMLRLLYFAAEGNDQPFGTEKEPLNRAVLLTSIFFAFMHVHSFAGSSYVQIAVGLLSLAFIGVLFAIVYLKRGYAVAAGSHVFVDIYMMFGII